MKVIIAGGRDYELTAADIARLDRARIELPITEVGVSATSKEASYSKP